MLGLIWKDSSGFCWLHIPSSSTFSFHIIYGTFLISVDKVISGPCLLLCVYQQLPPTALHLTIKLTPISVEWDFYLTVNKIKLYISPVFMDLRWINSPLSWEKGWLFSNRLHLFFKNILVSTIPCLLNVLQLFSNAMLDNLRLYI